MNRRCSTQVGNVSFDNAHGYVDKKGKGGTNRQALAEKSGTNAIADWLLQHAKFLLIWEKDISRTPLFHDKSSTRNSVQF